MLADLLAHLGTPQLAGVRSGQAREEDDMHAPKGTWHRLSHELDRRVGGDRLPQGGRLRVAAGDEFVDRPLGHVAVHVVDAEGRDVNEARHAGEPLFCFGLSLILGGADVLPAS